MRWNRKQVLPDLCAALVQAVQGSDGPAAAGAFEAVATQARQADAAQLTAGLRVLTPALAELRLATGGQLAVLAGGLVELGADPTLVLDTLASRVADGLERAALFPALWDKAGDGVDRPVAGDATQLDAVVRRLDAAAGRYDVPPADARNVAEAWFAVGDWAPGLLVPLQRKDVRQALPHRQRLIDAAAATQDLVEPARWMYGLLLVLDDEPVIVLHRATGRGYRLTIGGIGDNSQLHTLLAATLIGDPDQGLIAGTPPEPQWVAAATDGDLHPPGGIAGRLHLVDAFGTPIWNEGRPVDIPKLHEQRVIVVDPAPDPRTWDAGRAYPLMRPTITLDGLLEPDEAAQWMAKVAPASTAMPAPGPQTGR